MFKGIIKVMKPSGDIKFNPVFYGELEDLVEFKENDETEEILLWDLSEEIGYVDEVDKEVIAWCKSISH
jgi:8-oxo-dGTP diphosphatase